MRKSNINRIVLGLAVVVMAALVGAGLGLQLLLSLFDLFGRAWKISLFVLIVLMIGGGYGLKQKVIDPQLQREKPAEKEKPADTEKPTETDRSVTTAAKG